MKTTFPMAMFLFEVVKAEQTDMGRQRKERGLMLNHGAVRFDQTRGAPIFWVARISKTTDS